MRARGSTRRYHKDGQTLKKVLFVEYIVCLFDVESGARKRLYTEVPQGWSNPEKSFICRIVCLFDVVSGACKRLYDEVPQEWSNNEKCFFVE